MNLLFHTENNKKKKDFRSNNSWHCFYTTYSMKTQFKKKDMLYESVVGITNTLWTITDPLKVQIKMDKTDPKKVPSQKYLLLFHLGTINQLFTKKNPLHNPFRFSGISIKDISVLHPQILFKLLLLYVHCF